MTDNQLNALVAEKVMSWKRSSLSIRQNADPMLETWVDDDGNVAAMVVDWQPANDIAAAWQVALKVASLPGYSVTIHVGDEVWIEKAVETDSGNTHLITWQDVARVGTAEGDARAICLAALDAVGVTVEVRAGGSMTWDISAKDHDELRSMFGVEVEG